MRNKKVEREKMLNKILILKTSNLIYIYIFINAICKGIGLSNDDKIYSLLLCVGLLLVVYKIVNEKYSRIEMAVTLCFLFAGLMTFLVTKKATLFLTVITITAMKNTEESRYLKTFYNIKITTFILLVVLSLAELIPTRIIYDYRSGGFITRNSLGYGHPNTTFISLYIIISVYTVLKKGHLNILDYLICIFANIFIYHFSLSRAGAIVVFLHLAINLIFDKIIRNANMNVIKYLCISVFIICILLSFFTAFYYGKNSLITYLNKVVNGRIQYSSYYLKHYPMTLFGNHNLLLDENAQFDNSYVLIYLQYGLLGFVVWIIIMTLSLFYIILNGNKGSATTFITISIYLFMESFGPNIYLNYIMLFAGHQIYQSYACKLKHTADC